MEGGRFPQARGNQGKPRRRGEARKLQHPGGLRHPPSRGPHVLLQSTHCPAGSQRGHVREPSSSLPRWAPARPRAAPRPSTGPRGACSESDGERAGSNAPPPSKPFAPSACLRGPLSPAEPSHRKADGDGDRDSSALPAGLERGKMGAVPAAFAGRVGVASDGLPERRRCIVSMRTSPVLRAGGVPPPLRGDWVTFVAGAHARLGTNPVSSQVFPPWLSGV